ncbi:MAG: conditioned medium-induced protein 4 [Halodesulfurarchaeum sp.]|nr:conditioned medium-induced protein 4 [Halodesulfurarchaeum sp.]
MGDRTEELRELFESVTGTESVTERQRRGRGSLTSEREPFEAIAATIEEMAAARDFETELPTSSLVQVVAGFYRGDTDQEIAEALEAELDGTPSGIEAGDPDADTVARARLDLHLVREAERPDETVTALLFEIEDGTETVASVADRLDRAESTVQRWLAVRETQAERRRVADRYRQAFESALGDRDIADRLTAGLEETGLDESLEDQEVDVDM